MTDKPLYLFVWEEFCPDWSDGLAFAIAENLEEAKGLVAVARDLSVDIIKWGEFTSYPLPGLEFDLLNPSKVKITKAVHGGG